MSYEDSWALCEDGTILISSDENYFPFTVPDEIIKDISGGFVLTESGRVYQILISESQEVSYQKVSDGPVIRIDASETASRCVGICENKTAVMWSDLEPLDLSEWNEVIEVSAGFNYCVGLTARGEILYADYNKRRESEIRELLKQITAEHVTCGYETLAVLKKDGSVEIIDLAELSEL